MSQRRMFSPDIVESPEFLSMPISTQALYFHLGMYADDDGFVHPQTIMRILGMTGDDNIKILIGKRFVLPFESGIVVIKHWLIHNMIRGDRYKPTRYQDEKNTIFIKKNKAYSDSNPIGLQNGNQMAPQVRLGKVRLGKDSIGKNTAASVSDETSSATNQFLELFKSVNPSYERFFSNKTQRAAIDRLIRKMPNDKLTQLIVEILPQTNGQKFSPRITTPTELESKLGQLFAFIKQEQSKTNLGVVKL